MKNHPRACNKNHRLTLLNREGDQAICSLDHTYLCPGCSESFAATDESVLWPYCSACSVSLSNSPD